MNLPALFRLTLLAASISAHLLVYTQIANALEKSESEPVSSEITTQIDALKGTYDTDRLITLLPQVARSHFDQGKFTEAQQALELLVQLTADRFGEDHPETLKANNNLVVVLQSQGKIREGRLLQERLLPALRESLGDNHPDTLMATSNFAGLLYELGEFKLAGQLVSEVLEARTKRLGLRHPDTLFSELMVARIMAAEGDLEEAKNRLESTSQNFSAVLGGTHPFTLASKADLALVLQQLGDNKRSRELREEVLDARSEILGSDHPDTLISRAELAATLANEHHLLEARHEQEELLQIFEQRFGPTHPATLRVKNDLAITVWAQEDLHEARRLTEEILAVHDDPWENKTPVHLAAESRLAEIQIEIMESDSNAEPGKQEPSPRAEEETFSQEALAQATEALDETASEVERTLPLSAELPEPPPQNSTDLRIPLVGAPPQPEPSNAVEIAETEQSEIDDREWQQAASILEKLNDTKHYKDLIEMADAWLVELRKHFGSNCRIVRRVLSSNAKILLEEGNYLAAANYFEEQVELSISAVGKDNEETLAAQSNLAIALGELGEVKKAMSLMEDVAEAMERIHGPEHQLTLRAKANLGTSKQEIGDLAAAQALQLEALAGYSKILGPEHPDVLTQKSNIGLTLFLAGELEEARRIQEELLVSFEKTLGPTHSLTLSAKGNLALTLTSLGESVTARQHAEELLSLRRASLGSEHPETLLVQNTLSLILYELGDILEARTLTEQLLASMGSRFGTNFPGLLAAKNNLAAIRLKLGNMTGARELLEELLETLRDSYGESSPNLLTAKSNFANTLLAQGQFAEAQQYFEDLIDPNKGYPAGHPDLTKSKIGLARTHSELGENEIAFRILEAELLTLQNSPDASANTFQYTIRIQQSLAAIELALGNTMGARRRALEVLELENKRWGVGEPNTWEAMQNLGTILNNSGESAKSVEILSSLSGFKKLHLGSDYLPSTEADANLHFQLGLAKRALTDLEGSFTAFWEGLEALDSQAFRIDISEAAPMDLRTKYEVYYRLALNMALARGRLQDAFAVLEKYRSRSLLPMLRGDILDSDASDDSSLGELIRISKQISALPVPVSVTDLDIVEKQKSHLWKQRETIHSQIIRRRQSEAKHLQPATIDELQQLLEPGTLLLAYSIGVDEGYLFTLSRDTPLAVHRLGETARRESLRIQVDRLLAMDTGPDRLRDPNEAHKQRLQQSVSLFRLLLEPALNQIARADRLLFLPDGPLHELHFSSLNVPPSDGENQSQYLIELKPIHFAQSAAVYFNLRRRYLENRDDATASGISWIGFGDPIEPPAFEGDERPILGDLIHSRSEILSIGSMFPAGQAASYVDGAATEAQVKQLTGRAGILHFAVHAIADSDRPLDSYLVLGNSSSKSEPKEDGKLQAWEIIDQLSLSCNLVVLSACSSATGPNRGGEGMIGLSRAFQIAGARSVLASLWEVDDDSTYELMSRFYRHFLAGETKDVALRSAQLELLRGKVEPKLEGKATAAYTLPYHWAGFELIGDWR